MVDEPLEGPAVGRWCLVLEGAVARRPHCLVLDLSGTPAVDEAGLVLLLQTHRAMDRSNGRLILRRPRSSVRRMLSVGRIDHVLDIEDDGTGRDGHHPRCAPAPRPFSRETATFLRILLMTLAVAAAVTAALGTLFSASVLLLTGAALLVVALVMGALVAPARRRGA